MKKEIGFKPGRAKTGGRVKGVKNKKTVDFEELKTFLLNEGAEKYVENLKKLKGREYTAEYIKMVEFVKPKLSRIQGSTSNFNYDISNMPVKYLSRIITAGSEDEIMKIIAEYESDKAQSVSAAQS